MAENDDKLINNYKSEVSFHCPSNDGIKEVKLEGCAYDTAMNVELRDEKEYLRETLNRLGVGNDGYLSLSEMEAVCRAIGMEKLASEVTEQLFSKLNVARNGRISFDDLFLAFNSGKVCDSPNQEQASGISNQEKSSLSTTEVCDLSECGPFSPELFTLDSLDRDGTGWTTVKQLTDAWSSVGLTDGFRCLKIVGLPHLPGQEVSLQSLIQTLDCEIRSQLECREESAVHRKISLCSLLYEVTYLRSICESSNEERDKLKLDIGNMNDRFALMTQDVDDHNAKLENNFTVRLGELERIYKEQISELKSKLEKERENEMFTSKYHSEVMSENSLLKAKELKLINRISSLEKEVKNLESENSELNSKISDSSTRMNVLEKHLHRLADLEAKVAEYDNVDFCAEELQSALTQNGELKKENQRLRDENDELLTQIETLSSKQVASSQCLLDKKRAASSSEWESSLDDCPGSSDETAKGSKAQRLVGMSAPRVFTLNSSNCDESFHDEDLVDNYRLKTNSPYPSLLQSDASPVLLRSPKPSRDLKRVVCQNCADLKTRLDLALEELEMSLKREEQHQRNSLNESNPASILQTLSVCDPLALYKSLKNLARVVKSRYTEGVGTPDESLAQGDPRMRFTTIPEKDENESENEENKCSMGEAYPVTEDDLWRQLEVVEMEVKALHRSWVARSDGLQKQKALIQDRCERMEREIQYLKMEREKSDNYWNMKLQEEQDYYEGERQLYDEKFLALEEKIREYEDLATGPSCVGVQSKTDLSEDSDDRLSTIEESVLWERQVTDLEEEVRILQGQLRKLEQEKADQESRWNDVIAAERSERSRLSASFKKRLRDSNQRRDELQRQFSAVQMEVQLFRSHLRNEADLVSCTKNFLERMELGLYFPQNLSENEECRRKSIFDEVKCSTCNCGSRMDDFSHPLPTVQMYQEVLQKVTNADILVFELFRENAELMKALQVTEQRQKVAERHKMKLNFT